MFLVGTIMCTLYGQFAIKWRISFYGPMPESLVEKALYIIVLFKDPVILSGFLSAFIASLFWLAAMTKFEVSFALPIVSSTLLVLTVVLGGIVLKEDINGVKIIGMMLIASGIALMSKAS